MLRVRKQLVSCWMSDFLFYLDNTALEERLRTKCTLRNLPSCLALTKIKKDEGCYGIENKKAIFLKIC